ncbi:nuclear mRNA splicing protein [Tremella mesenterica]|uniref:Splicing factor YJU2 n=1 Tax=Tremella mesenterica TaxID=5217 RepID=A0A4Q1BFS9_TREME|nr:nuclear mRNA splicing protein [Tremella mesenterica]
MSERKVLNKYFPPDFDPSKIKRRKGMKDPQQVIRLMAPFSMRCNRCGEYVYKGKKFNARKETAVGEEYYGIKIFRFYIKCPMCSSEITFKTDPKNADYICEHGATRNFENWSDADPNKRVGAMPDAAADDEYDSDGNPTEAKVEKDAMADLERSQEQSRREMEMMDELADLRQRNARLELSNVNADPDALLAALHAERESAAEEVKRRAEEEEDDALVKQYFSKINPTIVPPITDIKGKGKQKAVDQDVSNEDDENGEYSEKSDSEEETGSMLPALTIKRRPVEGTAEPTVASILAAKGKALEVVGAGNSGSNGINGSSTSQMQIKRKREGMQKLLGIKKKVKV